MLNKKAQGMPMNVVIIAIIVLVVLVILIAFFAGGFSSIVGKVRELFGGQTSGQQRDIVVQTCQNLCETAGTYPVEVKQSSGFCKQTFLVDLDSNPETKPVRVSCSRDPGPDSLTNDDKRRGIKDTASLGISCLDVDCQNV